MVLVPEDALTVPDIARLLQVNPATVRLWINQGDLKGHRASPKPQARWWVRPEDLQAMLDERANGSQGATDVESDYRPGPDEPGLGMLSSIDIGEDAAGEPA